MTYTRIDLAALTGSVVTRIMASCAEVSAELTGDALARAGCSKLPSLRAIDHHPAEHPSALVAASPHVPLALVRLAYALNDLGAAGVVLPPCEECGAQKRDLPFSVESSRVVYDEFLVTRGGDVNAVIG
ncbi:hypothetical protein [Kribbella sp. NBC_00359]|uniref:hypothetical protein n=1 Tax=Kribbella sp. NBC_00359 TaxID=2975966 RepID=UPI002E1EDFC1